jgi:hypothetical protein
MPIDGDEAFPCPCCGYLTLPEAPPGTFFICPVCFWEDDNVQFADPAYSGGANEVSLDEARANFRSFGASSESVREHVRRPEPRERPE